MSASKWAYSPEKCDGDFCPGDCDQCSKASEPEEESTNFSLEKFIGDLKQEEVPHGFGHIIVNGVDITDRVVSDESMHMSESLSKRIQRVREIVGRR